MAEPITIARPYARAVFDVAKQEGNFKSWSELLQVAAMIAADERVIAVMHNPKVSQEQIVDLFFTVCEPLLTDKSKNLLRTLTQNRRLYLLPMIASLYEKYRHQAEKTVEVDLTTAFELNEDYQQKFVAVLSQRFAANISLTCKVNPALIGGAIIRAGDQVIDDSVSGKLKKLSDALM